MTMLDERELAQKIRGQLQECAGWDGDRISEDRKRALDYYFQRPRGDEVEGRSNVVSGDVSAMVEANLAQMLESFTSDNIAEFDADGPEDDDQAELESFAVVAAVMKDNNGYAELGTAIKDALLLRNGWMKVWIEETRDAETVELENATAEAIAALKESVAGEVELLEFDEQSQTATVRVVAVSRKLRSEAVDPAHMLYPKQWPKTDVQEIPFIAEIHREPRSKLLERGFPKAKVERLKAWDFDLKVDSIARDVGQEVPVNSAVDKWQEVIQWFECYVLVSENDGTTERRRIAVAGTQANSLLENEPAALVPYSTGSPFLNPHRLTGVSLYDKLRQTQDMNTALERGLLDNVDGVLKSRTAYLDGKVNTEDLSDGRINGNIRVRASVGDVNRAITHVQQPDISQGILANIQHQRSNRTELGGAALELASGSMQMAGGRIGSQGVDRAFSVMEQLAAHMTKNMAGSLVRNVFLLAHATMREFFDRPVNVKRRGRWESPVPALWKVRTRVTVKLGMSPNERARKENSLRAVVDSQIALARENLDDVLVNVQGFYKALTDWARVAGLPNPEQYYLDPSSDASQEAAKRKDQQAAQQAEMQTALMRQAVGLEQLRSALDKYQSDQKTELEYWKETLHAEIEEAKIVGKATADLIAQTKFGGKANGKEQSESREPEAGGGGAA